MSQLRELATPFKGHLVKAPPKGKFGSYVSHSTVNERALSVVGPHSFDIIEVIRSHDGRVAGVLGRLTAVIDGTEVTVTEAGDEEHPDQGTDGANLKNAASDAYKRCWMRLGLGLHLWSQDDYFLDRQLDKQGGTYSITTPGGTLGPIPIDSTPEQAQEIMEGRRCPECLGRGGWMGPADNTDIEECSTCGGTGVLRDKMPGQEALPVDEDDPERPF